MSAGIETTLPLSGAGLRAVLQAGLGAIFGVDLRTLALFRVALSAVLLWDLLHRFADLTAFYSDAGILPRSYVAEWSAPWEISLYMASGSSAWAGLLLSVQTLAAVALLFGWRTRLVTIISFVMWGWLINRNTVVTTGADPLIASLLFWGCLLPLSARWSIDAALSPQPPRAENSHLSWAGAGLLIQVMSVYFFSAILKDGVEWTRDFTAVYYTMRLDQFASPLGQWVLLDFPGLMKALTIYVWWLELAGPVLILIAPLFGAWGVAARALLMLCFMTMHLGFALFMEVGHFPYVSLASLTVFTGAWFWDRALVHSRVHLPVAIYYDRDCGFCRKMCLLFRTFLGLRNASIQPAQGHPAAGELLEQNNSWVVIDDEGRAWLKWQAFVALIRVSPVLGWLYRGLSARAFLTPGNAAYDFVARHRESFGAVSTWLLPQRQERFEASPGWQKVAAVAIAVVLLWNLGTVRMIPEPLLQIIRPTIQTVRLWQTWNMFAPYPMKGDGWYVIEGRRVNGETVNILHPDRPVSYDKPRVVFDEFKNFRWHKVMNHLYADNDYPGFTLEFGKYICRNWNGREFDPARRIKDFTITYMLEVTPPPGKPERAERRLVWTHWCFAKHTSAPIVVTRELPADAAQPSTPSRRWRGLTGR